MHIARQALTAAAVVGLVAGGFGIASASIPASNGTIDGCYNRAGSLRVIDSSATCPKGYKPLDWSQTGPQGPAGIPGPQGPQGPAGNSAPGALPSNAGPAVLGFQNTSVNEVTAIPTGNNDGGNVYQATVYAPANGSASQLKLFAYWGADVSSGTQLASVTPPDSQPYTIDFTVITGNAGSSDAQVFTTVNGTLVSVSNATLTPSGQNFILAYQLQQDIGAPLVSFWVRQSG